MTRHDDASRLSGMGEDIVISAVAFHPAFAAQARSDLGPVRFDRGHRLTSVRIYLRRVSAGQGTIVILAPRAYRDLFPRHQLTTITTRRDSRGRSRRMSAARSATQPAVGDRSGRARWKKIALPRALTRGRML